MSAAYIEALRCPPRLATRGSKRHHPCPVGGFKQLETGTQLGTLCSGRNNELSYAVAYSNRRCLFHNLSLVLFTDEHVHLNIYIDVPHTVRLHETGAVDETDLTQSPRQQCFMWMRLQQMLFQHLPYLPTSYNFECYLGSN
jgi:hypothetical protein